MPADDRDVWVQLATRIPKALHRELKLHCVKNDVSVMEFVVGALQEKVAREATRARRAKPARRKP
jgi:predicted HicB family RNase H-like nuclease